MTEQIKISKADGVLTLVMDRPTKKNALTDAMYGVLADQILAAQDDASVRVVIIRSEGDMFTAGNDLLDFASAKPDGGPAHVGRFIRGIAEFEKPLIAAVQGRAVGIGTTMLLHCDYVVLADNALLTTPFVGLGLVPEAASSMLLPSRIGYLRAYAMLALGEAFDAPTALSLGLANAVVPASELIDAIDAAAARFAKQPSGAMRATKRLMRNASAVVAQMDIESKEFTNRLQSPEAREAFAAFIQKREPDFMQFA